MKTRDPNLLPELRARMALLHETLFEQPEENRYSSFVKRGRAAYPELVRALDAPITEQRIDALLALGASFEREGATPEALAAVVAHARARTPKGAEQHASLFALGKSRDPSILRGFTALLADDEPERIRVACWLLGHARHSPAAPQLAWLATHDGPAPVRAAAAWALGQIGGDEARRVLGALATRGQLLDVVVGALGDAGALEELDLLLGLVGHPVAFVRYSALASIAAILRRHPRHGHDGLAPTLTRATHDPFEPVAAKALMMLAELGRPVDEVALRRALDLGDAEQFSDAEAYYLTRRAS